MKTLFFSAIGASCLFTTGYGAVIDTVAYWSYDTPTLTLAGGNITGVADLTGKHNASVGIGIGSATAANGGPTFTSNPIPASNSVAGRFGQALTLTGFNTAGAGGGQFLMFPELTELMAASAPSGYTVSMWIKTLNTGFSNFASLSSWGNAATTPGRFSYGFGPNGTAQIRAQARFDNASANGGDIYARSVTTATLNDDSWHMLSWTFDTGTGALNSYFDGLLVDTFTSTAANFQMINSSSTLGSLGLKGDTGTFINGSISWDEIRVFRGAATDTEIQSLFSLNVVPEPTAFSLLGIGTLLWGAFRRRSS